MANRIESNFEAADNPFKKYLNDIGTTPLLSQNKEVELAKIMERGKIAEEQLPQYASFYQTSGYPELSSVAFDQLRDLQKGADLAREIFINANLRLVVSIAKKYTGRGIPILDLIQEGNISLYTAIEKFDYTKGFKFSTYATWWIRQTVGRSIKDQARTIRLPVHQMERNDRLHKFLSNYYSEDGKEPSMQKIADNLGWTIEQATEYLSYYNQRVDSLNKPLSDDSEIERGDSLEDNNAIDPQEAAVKTVMIEDVRKLKESLSLREQLILTKIVGEERTLEEVGREFGITRERVRQIGNKALRKLKNNPKSSKLRDYVKESPF